MGASTAAFVSVVLVRGRFVDVPVAVRLQDPAAAWISGNKAQTITRNALLDTMTATIYHSTIWLNQKRHWT
jgi:hypothetical protein